MKYKYLLQAKISPKFGKVLPIELNPLKVTHTFYNNEEIFNEIEHYFQNYGVPDFLWLKGTVLSSVSIELKHFLKKLKKKYPNQQIGVYANISLFQNNEIRRELSSCDYIALNLNSVKSSNFLKCSACSDDVECTSVIDGIRLFKEDFGGYLSIYTMFLKGINDTEDDLISLKKFLIDVKPNQYSVSIYDEAGIEPISETFKREIMKAFKQLPFEVSFVF